MNYEEKLIELSKYNNNLIVLTSENRASIRNFPKIVPNQFLDTGINEQSLIGIAAGMAIRGRLPIVHALAAFLTMRSFEFIRTDIGYPNLNVKLVGNFAGFLSTANGPTHQAIEDISLMRGIPNMNIYCPADEDDLIKGFESIVNYNRPFYVRFNDRKSLVEHSEFALGKAEIFGDGDDVALLTYGTLFSEAYQAHEELINRGFHSRLLNLRSLKPIDQLEIKKAIKECKTIVVIEDHFRIGGLSSILAEILMNNKLSADVLTFSLENKFFKPLKLEEAINYEGFSTDQLVNRIIDYINTKNKAFNVEWSNI